MKKFLQKKLNQKGLTLVELLAVIVILGIIAAIAVPAIGNIITNSKVSALKADGQNALSAANIYFAENSAESNTVDVKDLAAKGYLEDSGKLDKTSKVTKSSGEVTAVTITGKSINGNVNVEFVGASAADINAAGNKTEEGNTKVKITR